MPKRHRFSLPQLNGTRCGVSRWIAVSDDIYQRHTVSALRRHRLARCTQTRVGQRRLRVHPARERLGALRVSVTPTVAVTAPVPHGGIWHRGRPIYVR